MFFCAVKRDPIILEGMDDYSGIIKSVVCSEMAFKHRVSLVKLSLTRMTLARHSPVGIWESFGLCFT
jgi:hypothetical protein